MISIDGHNVKISGPIDDIINQTGALIVAVKAELSIHGISEEEADRTINLSIQAQTMARAGMSMDEVEEVLGIPIDREKSHIPDMSNTITE